MNPYALAGGVWFLGLLSGWAVGDYLCRRRFLRLFDRMLKNSSYEEALTYLDKHLGD